MQLLERTTKHQPPPLLLSLGQGGTPSPPHHLPFHGRSKRVHNMPTTNLTFNRMHGTSCGHQAGGGGISVEAGPVASEAGGGCGDDDDDDDDDDDHLGVICSLSRWVPCWCHRAEGDQEAWLPDAWWAAWEGAEGHAVEVLRIPVGGFGRRRAWRTVLLPPTRPFPHDNAVALHATLEAIVGMCAATLPPAASFRRSVLSVEREKVTACCAAVSFAASRMRLPLAFASPEEVRDALRGGGESSAADAAAADDADAAAAVESVLAVAVVLMRALAFVFGGSVGNLLATEDAAAVRGGGDDSTGRVVRVATRSWVSPKAKSYSLGDACDAGIFGDSSAWETCGRAHAAMRALLAPAPKVGGSPLTPDEAALRGLATAVVWAGHAVATLSGTCRTYRQAEMPILWWDEDGPEGAGGGASRDFRWCCYYSQSVAGRL